VDQHPHSRNGRCRGYADAVTDTYANTRSFRRNKKSAETHETTRRCVLVTCWLCLQSNYPGTMLSNYYRCFLKGFRFKRYSRFRLEITCISTSVSGGLCSVCVVVPPARCLLTPRPGHKQCTNPTDRYANTCYFQMHGNNVWSENLLKNEHD
jgi:hypothetical protein